MVAIDNEKAIRYHKKLFVMSLLLFVGMIAFFGVLLYWMFIPLNVMTVVSPASILTPEVYPGENLVYEIDYCKYVDKSAVVTRRLINGEVIALPTITTDAATGCHQLLIATTTIPEHLDPGVYSLEVALDYHLNPIRHAHYEFKTEEFVVLPFEEPDY